MEDLSKLTKEELIDLYGKLKKDIDEKEKLVNEVLDEVKHRRIRENMERRRNRTQIRRNKKLKISGNLDDQRNQVRIHEGKEQYLWNDKWRDY